MKALRMLCYAASFALLLPACDKDEQPTCVQGSGPEIAQPVAVGSFHAVKLDMDADVVIHYSVKNTFVVTAQGNLIDNMLITNTNGRISISAHECFNGYVRIDLYAPYINDVELNAGGSIISEGIFNIGDDPFAAYNNGSGDIIFSADAGKIDAVINGSGDIKMDSYTLDMYLQNNGSGRLSWTGAADYLNASVTGSGKIAAFNGEVNIADAFISGSGDIELNCAQDLAVNISGSGNVNYIGNPLLSSVVITGSGQVINRN